MKTNPDSTNRFRILKGGKISLVVSALLGSVTLSFAAPSGGSVVSGSATISQSGKTTNINQSTGKASINWNRFSIASDESVNFNQPNVNSITLNRVIGNERSVIDGALNANGQVWLLNSNGVLFGKNASINTSGLLATTKELSDTDFQNSNYSFKGNSTNSIINEGTITVQNSGYVILASNEVRNSGTIEAVKGNVHLSGANEYTINLNGNSLVDLTVDKGVLDALVKNSGTIIADGGEIYLTTNAVNELLRGVVNNTGVIEANSLDGVTGYVELFAHGGTAEIGGTIKAEDGFVETSGKELSVDASTKVIASKWLLDPTNIIIENTGGSNLSGASVSATAIQNNLATTDIELQADEDITVNENITWGEATKLTLTAGDEIYVNSTIENTNSTDGGVYFNAANTADKVIFGGSGKVIVNNVFQLQWINQALDGKYELGSNIDASATSSWNSNAGFVPIGTSSNKFTGSFDGLGHTISDLTINRPTIGYIGLFGITEDATIQNIGLVGGSVSGSGNVGGLVGYNDNGTITNSYATGSVSGSGNVGGLVGYNDNGTITNSYATGSVSGTNGVGGLVGRNELGTIENSYATGSVSGSSAVGGLVGDQPSPGNITDSYWNTQTTGQASSDGGTGLTTAQMQQQANFTGFDFANTWFMINGETLPFLRSEYSTTITNGHQLQLMAMDLSANYTLANNITFNTGSSTSMWGDKGFVPIGTSSNKFTGSFDGLGHVISNLTINRIGENYIGLFGVISNSGTVKDVGLTSVDIKGGTRVGALVGWNTQGSISNSYVAGSVFGNLDVGGLVGHSTGTITNSHTTSSVSGTEYVGGLVGQNNSGGSVTSSYATGDVSADNSVGGLVGQNDNGSTITNSYATGKVDGTGNYIGGLVGYNFRGASASNSYATGDVSGSGYVGGLVGINDNTGNAVEITNSYASGTVTGTANVGGLVGSNTLGGTITNSYWNTQTTGQTTSAGGTGLNTEEMQQANSFNGFDIVEDTTLSSSYKYPVLSTFNGGGSSVWKIYKEPVVTTTSSSNSGLTPQVQTQINNIITSNSNTNSIDTSTQTQINNIITSIINKGVFTNTDLNTLIKSGIDLRSFISQVNLVGGNMAIVPGVALTFLNGGINLPFGTNRELILENNNNQEEEDNRI